MYKQINDMYMLRERFVIIGVTGRTGSGCTTAAKFLSNDKCDLSSSFADLPPKDQQELNIIKSFLDRHWNKFYHIQFRDIISTFILESKYTEAKIYLKDKFSVNLNDFEETYNEFYEKNKIIDDLAKGSIEGFYTTNKCINEDKVEKLINYIFNELPQFTNKLRDFLNKDKPGDKERHGKRGKKKKTHPRRKDAAGLHMAEPERVSQALQRGAHIPEEPFPFLCFVVFKTSDFSFHTHLNSVLPPGKGRRWHRIPGRFLLRRTPYPTQVPPVPRQA